jgi:hypothetical protein
MDLVQVYFKKDAYLGILVRNDFANISELKDQFELLNLTKTQPLLLLPIEEIDFQNNDGEFRIYGSLVSCLILQMKLLINRAMTMFLMESWVLK